MKHVHKWLPITAFESTFLGNAIDNINAQSSIFGKIKTLINAHTGKVIGINLFNDVPKFGMQISLSNLNNPVTMGGVTMLVVGEIGRRLKVPHAGKLRRVGADIAIPSAIGSLFSGDAGTGFIQQTVTTSSSNGAGI